MAKLKKLQVLYSELFKTLQNLLKEKMIISNKVSDRERHYLQNLIVSGQGEVPDKDGKVSKEATHQLIVEKGFIVGAIKIIRKEVKK